MKRIVFPARRTVALEDVPVPQAGPGQIVVRVAVSGISAGTERSYYRGAEGLRLAREEYTYPIRPGYEADLIAVAGDPLLDVAKLHSVSFVMKGGAIVSAP